MQKKGLLNRKVFRKLFKRHLAKVRVPAKSVSETDILIVATQVLNTL